MKKLLLISVLFFTIKASSKESRVLQSPSFGRVGVAKCPIKQGNIIYAFRNLYNYITQEIHEFEDNCDASARGGNGNNYGFIRLKQKPTVSIVSNSSIKIYPNPTIGIINIANKKVSQILVTNSLGKIVYQNNLKDDINFNLIKPNVIFKYTINIYNHLSLEKDLISIYRIINFICLYKLDELVVIIDKIPQVISFQNLYILKNLILGLTPNTPIELIKKLKIKFNEVVILDINNSFYLNSKINEIVNEIKPENLDCVKNFTMFKDMYHQYPKIYDLIYHFNKNNISNTYARFKILK